MSEIPAASYLVLGRGGVATSLMDMAAKPQIAEHYNLEPAPRMVRAKDGWHDGSDPHGKPNGFPPMEMPESDIMFVASASTPDDQPMLSLMTQQLRRGGIVVTAEKSTIARHSHNLDSLPGWLGVWGTAGGGTRIEPVLTSYTMDPANIFELYKGMNGTLNYTFNRLAQGHDLGDIMSDAEDEGYVEPIKEGATHYDILGAEINDVDTKEVVVNSLTVPGFEFISRADIRSQVTPAQLNQAIAEARRYRYLTAMFPVGAEKEIAGVNANRIGGFQARFAGFVVLGGFLDITQKGNRAIQKFQNVEGANAAFSIHLGPLDGSSHDGYYFAEGDGAGPDPTATAMLDNLGSIQGMIALKETLKNEVRNEVLQEVAEGKHINAN